MKINERGYWENETSEGHGVDYNLMQGLARFFSTQSPVPTVIDIGCGEGSYTRYLNSVGISCVGYDGNPYTEQITNGFCKVADFSVPQNLGKFDWVISLEVAEHIPVEHEQVFIDNLCNHAKYGIILSWSIPSFGGDGHVNPRENEYVIEQLAKREFCHYPSVTNMLRTTCAPYPNTGWWFAHTLLVFE